MNPIQTISYTTSSGRKPFNECLLDLDKKTMLILIDRLNRVRNGNFGDCTQLKNASGAWEFKIDYGPGYRIYFGKHGNTIVVLLTGGDKKSQNRDITKAERYWLDYKESVK